MVNFHLEVFCTVFCLRRLLPGIKKAPHKNALALTVFIIFFTDLYLVLTKYSKKYMDIIKYKTNAFQSMSLPSSCQEFWLSFCGTIGICYVYLQPKTESENVLLTKYSKKYMDIIKYKTNADICRDIDDFHRHIRIQEIPFHTDMDSTYLCPDIIYVKTNMWKNIFKAPESSFKFID